MREQKQSASAQDLRLTREKLYPKKLQAGGRNCRPGCSSFVPSKRASYLHLSKAKKLKHEDLNAK
jgi:hypothetical protein